MGKNGSSREVWDRYGEGWTHPVKFGKLREQDGEFGWIRGFAEYCGVNWNVSVFAPRASTTSRK